jgi:hypothetical protein
MQKGGFYPGLLMLTSRPSIFSCLTIIIIASLQIIDQCRTVKGRFPVKKKWTSGSFWGEGGVPPAKERQFFVKQFF